MSSSPHDQGTNLLFSLHSICVFIICALTYALVSFHRGAPAILSKEISEEFNVTPSAITPFSTMYYWTYASMQPFSGMLADVYDPSYLIGGASIVAGIGSAIIGGSKSLSVAIIGRFIVGFGTGPTGIPILKIVTRWYPEEHFAILNGIMGACGGAGSILAQAPLRSFAQIHSWRSSFFIVTACGIVFGLFTMLIVKKDPSLFGYKTVVKTPIKKNEGELIGSRLSQLWSNLNIVITRPIFWFFSMLSFIMGGCQYSVIGLWGGPYVRDMFPGSNEGKMLTSISIAIIFGSVAIPCLSNYLKTRKWVIFGCAMSGFGVSLLFFFFDQKMSYWTMYILFFIYGIATGSFPSIKGAFITELCEPQFVATMQGCVNFFNYLGGASFQSITGYFLGKYQSENNIYPHEGYRYSLWLVMVISLFMTLIPLMFIHDVNKMSDSSCHEESSNEKAQEKL